MFKAVPIERRGRLIHDFPYRANHRRCPHAAIVNLTKSGDCIFDCVYCYAKGYPWSRLGRSIEVYENTPELLETELSSLAICPPLYFCAVTDPFQPLDLVYNTALHSMDVAVKNNVYFTIVTKSDLVLKILDTDWFDYKGLRVSLTCESINEKKLHTLSNAPSAFRRLRAIEQLLNAGVDVVARVDPIISGFTDDHEELTELFERLSSIGIKNVTISTGTFNARVFNRLTSKIENSSFSDLVAEIRAKYTLKARNYSLSFADRLKLYRQVKSLCGKCEMTLSICLEQYDHALFQPTQCTTLGKLTLRDEAGRFTPICSGDCLTACPDRAAPLCQNGKLASEYPYKWGTLRQTKTERSHRKTSHFGLCDAFKY
ncbi:MAG: radical SAM protein [Halobacteriota archaeon]